jgi:AbrB family looped-hinge helix DNA binding protein
MTDSGIGTRLPGVPNIGFRPLQGILVSSPCRHYIRDVSIAEFRVSDRGQMALPAEARRRWHLSEGGSVEVADLGDALLIVPAGRGGLRSLLREAILEAGGYSKLASQVATEDPELA